MGPNHIKPTHRMIAEACAWLIEFRTGDPSQAERDRFKVWLCTSPQHIQAYLEVAAAWSELPDKDPEGRIDIQQMMAAVRASGQTNVVELGARLEPTRIKPGYRFQLNLTAIAASLVLVLMTAAGAYLYMERGTYSTTTGEQRSLTLADGSIVELNAKTTVRVRYSEIERHIDLVRGQALFRVAKNETRPFIVRTGDTRVRAVGTQFDVYRKTSGTIVTVVEGRVAVTGDAIASDGPPPAGTPSTGTAPLRGRSIELAPIFLGAGEQLTVSAGIPAKAGIRGPHEADVEAATAWTQKRLVFEDTPLSEVAEEFNRYNIRPLVVADAGLQKIGVSGLYSSTDPAALIAFLNAQPGILVTEAENEIRISRR